MPPGPSFAHNPATSSNRQITLRYGSALYAISVCSTQMGLGDDRRKALAGFSAHQGMLGMVGMVGTPSSRRISDRRFYVYSALLFPAVTFADFARTYYLHSFFHTQALTLFLHIHGAGVTGWIVVFLVHTLLVAAHRCALPVAKSRAAHAAFHSQQPCDPDVMECCCFRFRWHRCFALRPHPSSFSARCNRRECRVVHCTFQLNEHRFETLRKPPRRLTI